MSVKGKKRGRGQTARWYVLSLDGGELVVYVDGPSFTMVMTTHASAGAAVGTHGISNRLSYQHVKQWAIYVALDKYPHACHSLTSRRPYMKDVFLYPAYVLCQWRHIPAHHFIETPKPDITDLRS